MTVDFDQVDIYVRPGSTDMRKQINGLSILVQEELCLDPFSGSLFLFCNRRRQVLKILYWDRSGFAMWQKRLEDRQRLPWPSGAGEAQRIDVQRLRLLLAGVDFWHAHRELSYRSVC